MTTTIGKKIDKLNASGTTVYKAYKRYFLSCNIFTNKIGHYACSFYQKISLIGNCIA